MKYTLILGSNKCRDCDAALVIDGDEVFRLRERTGDGQFCVDFDIRSEDGTRLAKVAKNNVIYVSSPDAYSVRALPKSSELVQTSTGAVIAKAEELDSGVVRVCGNFYGNGCGVHITEDSLIFMPKRMTLTGGDFCAYGSAILFDKDSVTLGVRKGAVAGLKYPYPAPFR